VAWALNKGLLVRVPPARPLRCCPPPRSGRASAAARLWRLEADAARRPPAARCTPGRRAPWRGKSCRTRRLRSPLAACSGLVGGRPWELRATRVRYILPAYFSAWRTLAWGPREATAREHRYTPAAYGASPNTTLRAHLGGAAPPAGAIALPVRVSGLLLRARGSPLTSSLRPCHNHRNSIPEEEQHALRARRTLVVRLLLIEVRVMCRATVRRAPRLRFQAAESALNVSCNAARAAAADAGMARRLAGGRARRGGARGAQCRASGVA
jgi:hypothetical protein